MLTERYGLTDDNGNITVITVDEILESYEIKGLSLEELQEKYVNTIDEYEEKINDYEERISDANSNYSELNSNLSILAETVKEFQEEYGSKENTEASSLLPFSIIFIIGVILAFFVGKYFSNNSIKK